MRSRTHRRGRRTDEAGFTLIEILVVLVMIGMLAGLVVPNVVGRMEQAKVKSATAEVERLKMAVEAYYLDTGKLPQRLEQLVSAPSDVRNWHGPYAKKSTLNDPWGTEYHYEFPGQHDRFDLVSYGSDAAPGGQDAATDIVSWE